ncbi:MAG: MBL fold metallo-hydrolase [bacterium]|nr:MBL fold metallo-hydrolase [bacterium]
MKPASAGAATSLDLGGDVVVTAILGGHMRLDGGAMFGVVPKPLWTRVSPPDGRNRIASACRCLLIRTAQATVLVDTGCGDRFDARNRDIFAVDAAVSLEASLAVAGVSLTDITHVLFTHLHFDHSAGALRDVAGELVPTFPDAVHIVQQGEVEDALAGRSIMRSSYVAKDLDILAGAVRWAWTDGDGPILPGIRVQRTKGHTEHHQSIFVEGERQTLVFPGDLTPTRAHLRPYWIMAYDMFPYDTFLRKQELAQQACECGWIVAWDHDPGVPWSRLAAAERTGFVAIDIDAAVDAACKP